MKETPIPSFLPLTGLYEPSAIVQLADGRFLVVEDEKEHPFSVLSITLQGRVSSSLLTPGLFENSDGFWKLDDLEGLALDRSGAIYAITSQSLDGDGEQKKSREKLVRFRVEGDRVLAPESFKGLKAALVAAHPELAAAARVTDVKGGGGLNVEALELGPEQAPAQQRLLVGFRGPLLEGHAIIAVVENPVRMLEHDEAPSVSSSIVKLDLGGNGIRGMSYIADLHGYLVIGGPVTKESSQFELWFWSGEPEAAARRVSIPGLSGLEHAEGVCPAVIDGQSKIVIVSDDGDRAKGRCAQFLILDPAQIKIAAA